MNAQSAPFKENIFTFIIKTLKTDIVFSASLLLAASSCLISPPDIKYIDFKVLICLFSLMVVTKAFEELSLLDKLAVGILNKCKSSRRVSATLILLCFFSSMLVTNDIALITFVPLTLIIGKKSNINMLVTVVLQTMAANIGSSLTPIGNPQNLFIFSYYHLTASQFFPPVILLAVTGLIWLIFLNHRTHNIKLDVHFDAVQIQDKMKALLWIVLFAVINLSVFEIINYLSVFFFTLALALIIDRSLLHKIDYPLLITFVCFFIFIGNISNIPAISDYMKSSLDSGNSTFFASILLSQLISNVPCSIFLSKFTTHWNELLLGVNIGGMGTIVASLASVISYKLFIKENPAQNKEYLVKFSVYNVFGLLTFTVISYFIVI